MLNAKYVKRNINNASENIHLIKKMPDIFISIKFDVGGSKYNQD